MDESKDIIINYHPGKMYQADFVDYKHYPHIIYDVEWYSNGNPKAVQFKTILKGTKNNLGAFDTGNSLRVIESNFWYDNGMKKHQWVSNSDHSIIKLYGWYQNGVQKFEVTYHTTQNNYNLQNILYWNLNGQLEAEIDFNQSKRQTYVYRNDQKIKQDNYTNDTIENIIYNKF